MSVHNDLKVQRQLMVGAPSVPIVTSLSAVNSPIPGSMYCSGPALFGSSPTFGLPEATVMIGPQVDSAKALIPSCFVVRGRGTPIDFMIQGAGMTIVSPTNIYTVAKTIAVGALTWNGAKVFNGVKSETGAITEQGAKNKSGIENLTGFFTKFGKALVTGFTVCPNVQMNTKVATKALALAGKGFDIPHPTKDNHRLRYICLEGPEVGAYIRGKLKDENVIRLPEYWKKLVKPESITVNLTPFGSHQELFVEDIQWGQNIIVKNAAGGAINCHYTVFAERVTHDKLQVEYEGSTPGDYPGDNTEYAIGGWDYAEHRGEPKA